MWLLFGACRYQRIALIIISKVLDGAAAVSAVVPAAVGDGIAVVDLGLTLPRPEQTDQGGDKEENRA